VLLKSLKLAQSIWDLEITLVDTSFATNPEQQRETLSNELDVDPAYSSGFCNLQQPLELRRHRLLISRFQVRVLGGSLLNTLQTVVNQKGSARMLGLLTMGTESFLYPCSDRL
jgi:hypothetical protein